MISQSVRKTLPLLKTISKLSKANRSKILSEVGGEDAVYKALREIAHNTIKGNVKLNNYQKAKLKPHARTLRNLCTSNKCLKQKKKACCSKWWIFTDTYSSSGKSDIIFSC